MTAEVGRVGSKTAVPETFGEVAFEQFLAARREPEWIQTRRRDAYARFCELCEQPLNPEEFKRTDLRAFRGEQFSVPAAGTLGGTPAAFETLLQDRAAFAGSVVHVDGQTASFSLTAELANQGVLFGDLSELLVKHRAQLEPHFMTRGVTAGDDRFAAWHAAFWTGGTVLYVPRNVEISLPLYSLIGIAGAGVADLSHTLIVLEEGASATVLEETASASAQAAGLHLGAVELLLGRGARLRYVQLQNWNTRTWHLAHQVGRVEADGELQWTVGGLGARLAHIHQHVHLDGRGAQGQVNGVTFATDRQVLSYYTQQSHHAPQTRSDLLYKDVLRDRSRVVWRGMIEVDKAAQLTDGYQRNDGLLLSADARADAIPGLEIQADDVRCTHGATLGRVDAEQILYCMSRGISRDEAMHMIVEGFFQSVYDRIPVPIVQETLSQAVARKLGLGD